MFIHYDRIEDSGKSIIAIHVQRGTNRSYYLAKKGLKPEGVYIRQGTSLALLLSDQCPHTIKAAVFEGEKREIFKDRREFNGSLLNQLKDVYDYIDLNN